MQLHSVVTTGSALAACLRTVATSGEGYGFLIGNKQLFPTVGFSRLLTAQAVRRKSGQQDIKDSARFCK